MSAIEATVKSMKTMADGTLRLQVDVEPYNVPLAIELVRSLPDVPIAIARLANEANGQGVA